MNMSRSGMSRSGISRSGSQSVIIQIPEFANRKWVWVVSGVVALLILVFAIPPIRHLIPGLGENRHERERHVWHIRIFPPISSGRFVAILPLQILGDQNQLGYLAQGIEEALSAKLFQLKGVRVTSADAASKVDQKQSLQKIARGLGANMLIQGMVQGNGDKIRIILNLEDVANGKRVWSSNLMACRPTCLL